MSGPSLRLRRFNMDDLKDDSIVVAIGKRGTGKSTLTQDILYHHLDIPSGVVISPTETANGFYSSMVPPIFIHHKYTPEITAEIMKRQKTLVKRIKAGEQIDNRAFFIMDDCLYDNSWKNDETIREIFMNGRHFKIFYILILQYVVGIPPQLRSNIDYVFLLRDNNMQNKRKIYDMFGGYFENFEMFNNVMDQCTENYGCVVIKLSSTSSRLEDSVFHYTADIPPPFRTCCDEAWEYNDQFYSEQGTEEEKDYKEYYKKKNRVHLKVERV